MSLKLRPQLGPGESPTGSGAGASKPATTATTAPHSQLTGAGECSPPPSSAAPRYIDDKDIRVLNNLLDDLKKLDTYGGQERLDLAATGRRDAGADEGLLHSGHGEQVTGECTDCRHAHFDAVRTIFCTPTVGHSRRFITPFNGGRLSFAGFQNCPPPQVPASNYNSS
jgi:hypothetical protein